MNYEPRYTQSWALLIGINEYVGFSPLSYACNDAEAIGDVLVSDIGFPKENVFLLVDGQATRSAILQQLGQLAASTAPNDRVFVFYAGHGQSLPGHNRTQGFLIPADGMRNNQGTWIRWQEFVDGAETIPAKHLLFVMDACFSGLLMQRAAGSGETRFMSDMLSRRARQAITAGKADEVVSDGGGPSGHNSIFTGHLLEALKGKAADPNGVITASALMEYTYRRVGQDPRSRQTPHYGHLDGDGDMIIRAPSALTSPIQGTGDLTATQVIAHPEPSPLDQQPKGELEFLKQRGYGDLTIGTFGHNPLTRQLATAHLRENQPVASRVGSFFSVIAEPISVIPAKADLLGVARKIQSQTWAEPPSPVGIFAHDITTTLKTLTMSEALIHGSPELRQFLLLDESGNVEFAVAEGVANRVRVRDEPEINALFYVQVVGKFWCVMESVREIYAHLGYDSSIRLTANIANTLSMHLIDFCEGKGLEEKRWVQPSSTQGRFDGVLDRCVCRDTHLQMSYRAIPSSLGGDVAKTLAVEFAKDLARAFNLQSEPRCFPPGVLDFPWNQYQNR